MEIKNIIKDNKVYFSFLRKGFAYYSVTVDDVKYIFPVPLDDIGDATLMYEDKAIIFMRYIRKALTNNEFVKQ